jgi:acetyltransferase-like isoleucine patch superfamily enzyme
MAWVNVHAGSDIRCCHRDLVNLYGCTIGNRCKIASFVEIQSGVTIGDDCKIQSFAFIPTGVTIGNGVFIGPHVCFTNDKFPRAVDKDGNLLGSDDWTITPTVVEDGASVGANATILCGVTIGAGALVGAGTVVTRDIAPGTIVVGNPAKVVG